MKKFLLIAALAAVAFGANAQSYTLEKGWEIPTPFESGVTNDVRAGFGMDGKFYINNKADETIYEVDENGLTGVTFPGGKNCGITRDEAGNILVSTATFPGAWGEQATIKVINPLTNETKEYAVPQECGLVGRCDFLGFAKGNFFEDGVLYLTGGNYSATAEPGTYTDGVAVFTVTGGEVNVDECYLASVEGLSSTTSTVINYYHDVNGDEAVLYVTRNAPLKKMVIDGENFTVSTVTLPGKGACNGTFPFVFENKEFYLYPTLPNYQNGWAIAENGAEAPIAEVASTVTGNMNGFQNNWVNAEVDRSGVTIYQYYPGGNLAVFRLTKDPEPAKVYMLGGNDQGWDPTSGTEFAFDATNKVYTATITFPAEYNWFGFTTELAENNDDGGWAYIEPFRFGAVAEGDYWYTGEEDFISLTWDEYHAIRIPGGEYNLTLSLEEMKLVIEKVVPEYIRGDVDGDQVVNISDVTALIDYLLSGATAPAAADCDLDQNVNISDVTALIDFLLSGHWAE